MLLRDSRGWPVLRRDAADLVDLEHDPLLDHDREEDRDQHQAEGKRDRHVGDPEEEVPLVLVEVSVDRDSHAGEHGQRQVEAEVAVDPGPQHEGGFGVHTLLCCGST